MSDFKQDIERLRTAVEQKVGLKMCITKDFEVLRDAIMEECHEAVSVSTLKRIWGHVQTDGLPRTSSLTLLAQYVGYADWKHFTEDHPVETTETPDTAAMPTTRPRRSTARRVVIVVATVAVLTLAVWATAMGGVFRHSSETETTTTTIGAPSGKRVLHKGDDYFRTIGEYLLLFGIEDGDSAYWRPLPGHKNVIVWGPEYGHPVWHNEGDKELLMPTITEYWIPLPGTSETYTPEYIKKRNADFYKERMQTDELRITFMKNIVNGFYVFLGIYRFDSRQSTSERTIWRRVADNCDLGLLDQLEQLRTDN